MIVAIIGGIVFYLWFVFLFATSWIASLIVLPFAKSNDDDTLQYEIDTTWGWYGAPIRRVTRGDQRVRYVAMLVIWPILFYLHYRFASQILAAFEWLYEDLLAPLLASVL